MGIITIFISNLHKAGADARAIHGMAIETITLANEAQTRGDRRIVRILR